VSGNQDTNVAQVASALPIAANETTNARTRTMVTGPMGRPRQRATPASSSTSPNTVRMAVVLPAPLGPRNPDSRPGRATNEQASRATRPPNRLVAPSSSSIAVPCLAA
jgi:hypothetical protein